MSFLDAWKWFDLFWWVIVSNNWLTSSNQPTSVTLLWFNVISTPENKSKGEPCVVPGCDFYTGEYGTASSNEESKVDAHATVTRGTSNCKNYERNPSTCRVNCSPYFQYGILGWPWQWKSPPPALTRKTWQEWWLVTIRFCWTVMVFCGDQTMCLDFQVSYLLEIHVCAGLPASEQAEKRSAHNMANMLLFWWKNMRTDLALLCVVPWPFEEFFLKTSWKCIQHPRVCFDALCYCRSEHENVRSIPQFLCALLCSRCWWSRSKIARPGKTAHLRHQQQRVLQAGPLREDTSVGWIWSQARRIVPGCTLCSSLPETCCEDHREMLRYWRSRYAPRCTCSHSENFPVPMHTISGHLHVSHLQRIHISRQLLFTGTWRWTDKLRTQLLGRSQFVLVSKLMAAVSLSCGWTWGLTSACSSGPQKSPSVAQSNMLRSR